MNQRTIPGFEPSPDSYAPAVRVLEMGQQLFRARGLSDPDDHDIWVAMIGGLINQQLANDPGGARWSALLDRASTSGPTVWPSPTLDQTSAGLTAQGPRRRTRPHEEHLMNTTTRTWPGPPLSRPR